MHQNCTTLTHRYPESPPPRTTATQEHEGTPSVVRFRLRLPPPAIGDVVTGPESDRSADGVVGTVDLDDVSYGPDGLVPAVVVDVVDGAVLMLAWMNRASLEQSLASGHTVFWSRSRQELWAKGATSGHVQRIVDIAVDCDADALLVTVEQTGVACHTGERSCFHRAVRA